MSATCSPETGSQETPSSAFQSAIFGSLWRLRKDPRRWRASRGIRGPETRLSRDDGRETPENSPAAFSAVPFNHGFRRSARSVGLGAPMARYIAGQRAGRCAAARGRCAARQPRLRHVHPRQQRVAAALVDKLRPARCLRGQRYLAPTSVDRISGKMVPGRRSASRSRGSRSGPLSPSGAARAEAPNPAQVAPQPERVPRNAVRRQ